MVALPRIMLPVTSAGIVLIAGCTSIEDARPTPSNPRFSVQELAEPTKRDAVACELLRTAKYRSEPPYRETPCDQVAGAVNHVIVAAQHESPPMYVVFTRPESGDDGIGPGRPRGPFVLFDTEGYIVPVFSAANYLDEGSDVFAYAGDDRMAIAHIIRHGSGKGDVEWTAQVLHIVPVTPAQQSALSVIVGPAVYGNEACLGFYWGWRRRDIDGDGVSEIEIGPRQDAAGNILVRATYRWSKEAARYDGPDGSVEAGFLRLDGTPSERRCCPYYETIKRFTTDRLKLPTAGDPSAVRRNDCDSGTISIIEF